MNLIGKNALQIKEIVVQVLRSEEHTSELQSRSDLVCRLLLEKKKTDNDRPRVLVFDQTDRAQPVPVHSTVLLVDKAPSYLGREQLGLDHLLVPDDAHPHSHVL